MCSFFQRLTAPMYTSRRCEDWPEFELERKATKQIAPMYTAPIYTVAYSSYVYSILLVTASCCAQAQVWRRAPGAGSVRRGEWRFPGAGRRSMAAIPCCCAQGLERQC
jgi:hypothetical protein